MSKPTIPCPHCHGKGRVRLPARLADVLAAIPRTGAATGEIARKIGLPNASGIVLVNNRLIQLREAGLVTRDKAETPAMHGQQFIYRRTKQ